MKNKPPAIDSPASLTRATATAWTTLYTAVSQGLVQALGFVAGVVIIRTLSPEQYAYYAIVTAGLGTMTVLGDGGVSSGVLAQGGAVWQDRGLLGRVIATGLVMRARLALLSVLVGVPLMGVLLRHQGAGPIESILIPLSIVPLFVATVSGHLLETASRLHQQLAPLQWIQVAANGLRVLLVVALLPLLPLAGFASIIAAAPQWWANWRLRQLADRYADWRTGSDPEIRARIGAQVRRSLPGAVYYAISGQLTIWLISVFGNSPSVAAVGALGRLAALLTVLTSVFGTLAVPRFARIPAAERGLIRHRYLQLQGLLAVLTCIPVAVLAIFPRAALSILGSRYTGLPHEAILMGLSSAAAILAGAAFSLGAARGVVAPPALTIAYSFATQVSLVLLLPVGTISGVIWIGLLSGVAQWFLHALYFEWRQGRSAS